MADFVVYVQNIDSSGKAKVMLTDNVQVIIDNKTSKYCPTTVGNIIPKIQ